MLVLGETGPVLGGTDWYLIVLGHVGRTVLAVTVEPGSYKVGTAAAGANRWIDLFICFFREILCYFG